MKLKMMGITDKVVPSKNFQDLGWSRTLQNALINYGLTVFYFILEADLVDIERCQHINMKDVLHSCF